jgi:hypothetical protein
LFCLKEPNYLVTLWSYSLNFMIKLPIFLYLCFHYFIVRVFVEVMYGLCVVLKFYNHDFHTRIICWEWWLNVYTSEWIISLYSIQNSSFMIGKNNILYFILDCSCHNFPLATH